MNLEESSPPEVPFKELPPETQAKLSGCGYFLLAKGEANQLPFDYVQRDNNNQIIFAYTGVVQCPGTNCPVTLSRRKPMGRGKKDILMVSGSENATCPQSLQWKRAK